MEKPPLFEQEKEIAEQDVINDLRSRKEEDSERPELAIKWIEQKEVRMRRAPELCTPVAAIESQRQDAKVFLAGGFLKTALSIIQGAYELADRCGEKDLVSVINEEMYTIEDKIATMNKKK